RRGRARKTAPTRVAGVRCCARDGRYLFSAPTKNSPGARDLSRRNAGKADPRLEISRLLRRPIFLRTKVRAPFARPANRLNTYDGRTPSASGCASRCANTYRSKGLQVGSPDAFVPESILGRAGWFQFLLGGIAP